MIKRIIDVFIVRQYHLVLDWRVVPYSVASSFRYLWQHFGFKTQDETPGKTQNLQCREAGDFSSINTTLCLHSSASGQTLDTCWYEIQAEVLKHTIHTQGNTHTEEQSSLTCSLCLSLAPSIKLETVERTFLECSNSYITDILHMPDKRLSHLTQLKKTKQKKAFLFISLSLYLLSYPNHLPCVFF